MPPKGKGGKGKGKSQGVVIDGVNTSEMTREQLEIFALRLKEELEREREERNFFQLERDKLRTYWEITRNELEEKDAELTVKNADMQENDEKHDDEIKRLRQIIKHIRYDEQLEVAHCKTQYLIESREHKSERTALKKFLEADKKSLKQQLTTEKDNYRQMVTSVKLEQQNEITAARNSFLAKVKLYESKFEHTVEELEEKIPLEYDLILRNMEDTFNKQFAEGIKSFVQLTAEDRSFFTDIVFNNIGLINELKIQLDKCITQRNRMTVVLNKTKQENMELTQPLKEAQGEVKHLRAFLISCKKKIHYLKDIEVQWEKLKKKHQTLKADMIVKNAKFDEMKAYIVKFREKFLDAAFDIKVQSHMRAAIFEEHIKALNVELDHKMNCQSLLVKSLQEGRVCVGPVCENFCFHMKDRPKHRFIGLLKQDSDVEDLSRESSFTSVQCQTKHENIDICRSDPNCICDH